MALEVGAEHQRLGINHQKVDADNLGINLLLIKKVIGIIFHYIQLFESKDAL